jgi:hypothetical protein
MKQILSWDQRIRIQIGFDGSCLFHYIIMKLIYNFNIYNFFVEMG